MAATRPSEAAGLNMAPIFHLGGNGLPLQLMMRLCTQVIISAFAEVNVPKATHKRSRQRDFHGAHHVKRLIEHPRFGDFDTSSLQLVLYGAAPIDDVLLQAIEKLPSAGFCHSTA